MTWRPPKLTAIRAGYHVGNLHKSGSKVMPVPKRPAIYHIVHLDRLQSIIAEDALLCDVDSPASSGTIIGMEELKSRRRTKRVPPHAPATVGQFVPFYLCPRSIMLFLIYKRNHPSLTYRGGQEPIIHLEADLLGVLDWAEANGRRYALTDGNAATDITKFRAQRAAINELPWQAIHSRDFRDALTKAGKQSEFLLHKSFPWSLVSRIGVYNEHYAAAVRQVLQSTEHRPVVEVLRDWYY